MGVAVAACLFAGPAQGQNLFTNPFKTLPTVHLEGTNGFDVNVYGARGEIFLLAEAPNFRVSYATEDAKTARKRLTGSFGDAGSIEMKFRGLGEPRSHTIKGCDGTYELQRGIWEGEMRFVGAGGSTSVFATTAPGRTFVSENLDCGSDGGGGGGGGGGNSRDGWLLEVVKGNVYDSRGKVNGTALRVSWLGGRKRAEVHASVDETNGPVEASFEAFTTASRKRVHLNRKRGRARIAPGYPFVGTARYRAWEEDVDITQGVPVGEGGPFWEGDLAVLMPGLGAVSLTGPKFRPSFGSLTLVSFRRERTFGAIQPPLAGFPAN